MNDSPSPWKRRLIVAVKLLIVAAVAYGVVRAFFNGRERLAGYTLTLHPWWLAAAGVLYLLSTLPAGAFWWIVLRAMGQSPSLPGALRAYVVGQVGKYAPGKALVVVLRAGLVGRGADPVVAAVAVFVETLTMMSVGAFLSAAMLPFWFHGEERRQFVLASIVLMALVAVPTLPPIFRRILSFIPVLRKDPARLSCLHNLTAGTLLKGWILIAGGWFIMGASLWAALHGMGADQADLSTQLPQFTTAVALANVAGFLSMIPGGLGARELVLANLLKYDFGFEAAWVVTIVLRLVWLLADVLFSVILYFMGPRGAAAVRASAEQLPVGAVPDP